jgi:hypothetical protein
VDQVATESDLMNIARRVASELGAKYPPAFSSIKKLLRASITEEMERKEKQSIDEFVDVWYSAHTWANLQNIRIY